MATRPKGGEDRGGERRNWRRCAGSAAERQQAGGRGGPASLHRPGGGSRRSERKFTDSGIEVKPVYTAEDVAGQPSSLGEPGEYPFTRGVHARCTAAGSWTMRQYAGFATAEESNERFRYLLERG